jgi:S-adenosylmethionine decarboxylase
LYKALGKHLILDVWGEVNSEPFLNMEKASVIFEKAAKEAGATVLNSIWHHFGEGYGYTGIIVLAESHLSAHVWPEEGYAAIDIFMCGNANPELAVNSILDFFDSSCYKKYESTMIERGIK